MKMYEVSIHFYESPVVWTKVYEITKVKDGKYYFRREGNVRDTIVHERELNKMRTLFPRIGDGDMHNRIYVVAENGAEASLMIDKSVGLYCDRLKNATSKIV